jgi:hypothetical protein
MKTIWILYCRKTIAQSEETAAAAPHREVRALTHPTIAGTEIPAEDPTAPQPAVRPVRVVHPDPAAAQAVKINHRLNVPSIGAMYENVGANQLNKWFYL